MTKIEPAQSAQPSTATARRVYIETYGCQMNVADSEVVASIMQMDGFHLTEDPELADAIFLNTCSVRDNAEQKVLNRIAYYHSIRRKKRRHRDLQGYPPAEDRRAQPLGLRLHYAWVQ